MAFFTGMLNRFRGAFDPNRLAMSQAFLAGDYGTAAEQFRQLQAEHERLRMQDRAKRKPVELGKAPYEPTDDRTSQRNMGVESPLPGQSMLQAPVHQGVASFTAVGAGRTLNGHEVLHGDPLPAEPTYDDSPDLRSHRLGEFEQRLPGYGSSVHPLSGFEQDEELPSVELHQPHSLNRNARLASFQADPGASLRASAEARVGGAQVPIDVGPQAMGAGRPIEDRAHRLGRLSAQYETQRGGPGTVSTGRGDPGGRSYGTWQLNRRMVEAFVGSNDAQRWARELQGLSPATPEFDAAWRRIAAREPEAFENAQYGFIRRENYENLANNVRRSTGVDLDSFGDTVRNVVWSTATQQGTVERLRSFTTAIRQADQHMRRNDPRYGELLIRNVYRARIEQALRQSRMHVGRGEHDRARTMQNVATRRLPNELTDALRMYQSERAGGDQGGSAIGP
jgi:hypothetical protein